MKFEIPQDGLRCPNVNRAFGYRCDQSNRHSSAKHHYRLSTLGRGLQETDVYWSNGLCASLKQISDGSGPRMTFNCGLDDGHDGPHEFRTPDATGYTIQWIDL